MKICIISNGFTGTTIPLAEHLQRGKHDVDVFYLLFKGTTTLDSLDLNEPIKFSFTPQRLTSLNPIFNYLSKDVRIYTKYIIKERNRLSNTPFGIIQRILNKIIIRQFCHKYIKDNYDIVNVIVYPRFMTEVCDYLNKIQMPFFITFHEVLNSLIGNRTIIPFVEKACLYNCNIVVHSEATKKDLLLTSNVTNLASRIHVIHFGAFEGYLAYGEGEKCIDEDDYLLYFGNILPYKGLSFLYNAIALLKKAPKIKVVVAGRGKDPILNRMSTDNRFVVINNYVGNKELAYLISHSRVIVCPYLAASQSGVVQTAMAFKKPVIATRVGAFEEVINDNNGILVSPGNSEELVKAITKCYSSREQHPYDIPKKYTWPFIVAQYDKLFRKCY